MNNIYTLVLLFGSNGLIVGNYVGLDACDFAGRAATKTKEIEYACLPHDQKGALAKPKKVPTPRPAPTPPTTARPQ